MSQQIRCDHCDKAVPPGGLVFHGSVQNPRDPFPGGERLDFCHYGCVELWARAQNGN